MQLSCIALALPRVVGSQDAQMLVSMISSGALQTVPAECPGCKMLQLESSEIGEDVWEATWIHLDSPKIASTIILQSFIASHFCTDSLPWPLDLTATVCHGFQVPGGPLEIPPLDRHATARPAAEQRLGPGAAVHGAACLVHPMEPGATGIAGDGNDSWERQLREKVTPVKLRWKVT